MRRRTVLLTLLVVAAVAADRPNRPAAPASAPPAATEDGIAVYFSPNGGCTDAIVSRLNAARKTIDLQAYSFTSTAIAKAIGEAHDRGVKVRAVLDKSNETGKYSGATYLAHHGIEVWIDKKHAIAHSKIIIVDGATIIGGSFNYTAAAEKSNAENLLILDDKPKIVAAYQRNFESHLAHSEKYIAPE